MKKLILMSLALIALLGCPNEPSMPPNLPEVGQKFTISAKKLENGNWQFDYSQLIKDEGSIELTAVYYPNSSTTNSGDRVNMVKAKVDEDEIDSGIWEAFYDDEQGYEDSIDDISIPAGANPLIVVIPAGEFIFNESTFVKITIAPVDDDDIGNGVVAAYAIYEGNITDGNGEVEVVVIDTY